MLDNREHSSAHKNSGKRKLWKPLRRIFRRSRHHKLTQQVSIDEHEHSERLEKHTSKLECDISAGDPTVTTDTCESPSSPGPSASSLESGDYFGHLNVSQDIDIDIEEVFDADEPFLPLNEEPVDVTNFVRITVSSDDTKTKLLSSLSSEQDSQPGGVEIEFSKRLDDEAEQGSCTNTMSSKATEEEGEREIFLSFKSEACFNLNKSTCPSSAIPLQGDHDVVKAPDGAPPPPPPPRSQTASQTASRNNRDSADSVTWVSHDTPVDNRPVREISFSSSGNDLASVSTASNSSVETIENIHTDDPVIRIRNAIFSSFADFSTPASADATKEPEEQKNGSTDVEQSGIVKIQSRRDESELVVREIGEDEESDDESTVSFLNQMSEQDILKRLYDTSTPSSGPNEKWLSRSMSTPKQSPSDGFDVTPARSLPQWNFSSNFSNKNKKHIEATTTSADANNASSFMTSDPSFSFDNDDDDWFRTIDEGSPWNRNASKATRSQEGSSLLNRSTEHKERSFQHNLDRGCSPILNTDDSQEFPAFVPLSPPGLKRSGLADRTFLDKSLASLDRAVEASTAESVEIISVPGQALDESDELSVETDLPTVASAEYNNINKRSLFCNGVMFEELADQAFDHQSKSDDEDDEGSSDTSEEGNSMGTKNRGMFDSLGVEIVHTVEEIAREGSIAVQKFWSKRSGS